MNDQAAAAFVALRDAGQLDPDLGIFLDECEDMGLWWCPVLTPTGLRVQIDWLRAWDPRHDPRRPFRPEALRRSVQFHRERAERNAAAGHFHLCPGCLERVECAWPCETVEVDGALEGLESKACAACACAAHGRVAADCSECAAEAAS